MARQAECSDAEWSRRVELAALFRLSAYFGWSDLTSTHISARLSDQPGHYLLNSYDLLFEEITASNLSVLDFDGSVHSKGHVLNEAGHIIHSGILKARPEINFVIHSHTRAGIAVSAMPGGLQPLSQHAGFVRGTLASHAYQDSTAVADEGTLLAADLGNNFAMLLENHGLLVVGRTPAEAFIYHYYLEMACKIQVDILAGHDKPTCIDDDSMAALADWGSPHGEPQGQTQWPALLRMLERSQPDYKT